MTDLTRDMGKHLQTLPTSITRDQSEWSVVVGAALPPDPVRDRLWSNEFRRLVTEHLDAFARVVKRHREARGWSQRRLSRQCAVSYGAINDLESCKYPSTTAHTIRELSDTLGITIDDLRAEITAADDEQEAA